MNLLEYEELRSFEAKAKQTLAKEHTLEDLELLYDELVIILKQKAMLTYGN